MVRRTILSVGVVIVAVVFALGVKSRYERFTLPQDGMAPNYPAGTTHWVSKGRYSPGTIALGDVVLFRKAEDGETYNFVCRVVGLPGQAIEVDHRDLVVDGMRPDREQHSSENGVDVVWESLGSARYLVRFDTVRELDYDTVTKLTVPEGQVFVMGDNRFGSLDSRHYGPIPITSVFGKMK